MTPSRDRLPSCTVVICTRDRPSELEECLEAASRLDYPAYDILVVANAPTDGRARVAAARRRARYIEEPIPGVCRAQNAGARAATGEIVAFLDDDFRPRRDWLKALVAEFEDPATMAVAGRIEARGLRDDEDGRLAALAGFPLGGQQRRSADSNTPFWFELTNFGGIAPGGNMAFRRSAFDVWPGFDPRLGRGSRINGANEMHAFFSLVARGFRVTYTPAAVVEHPAPKSLRELRRLRIEALSVAAAYLSLLIFEEPSYRWTALKYAWEALRGMPRSWRESSPARTLSAPPLASALALLKGIFRYLASNERPPISSVARQTVWTLACLAVLVRLAFVHFHPLPLDGDSPQYEALARSLALHGAYSGAGPAPLTPYGAKMPGYPLFLAPFYALFAQPRAAAFSAQAMLGAALVWLVFLSARRLLDERAALFAAAAAAFCPFTVPYAGRLLTESLAAALSAASLAVESSVGLGLCLGLMVLVRADFAMFPILMALWLVFRRYGKRRLRSAAILMAVSALVLVPWTARNALVFHRFQPLIPPWDTLGVPPVGFARWTNTWLYSEEDVAPSLWSYLWWPSEGAIRFPDYAFDSDSEKRQVEDLVSRRKRTADGPQRQAVEDEFGRLAARKARAHPIRQSIALPLKRALLLWAGATRSSIPAVRLLRIAYLALAVAGAWALRRRFELLGFLLLLPFYRTAVPSLLGRCESRYLIPAVPALLLLIGAALSGFSDAAKRRFLS